MEPAEAQAKPRAEATFRPHERIRSRADFQQVYDRGARVYGRLTTLFALPNGRRYARLGVAASRKLGSAVVRNRAKRLIREAFRRCKPAPGFDVVVVAKRDLVDATLSSLEAEYRRNLDRARLIARL